LSAALASVLALAACAGSGPVDAECLAVREHYVRSTWPAVANAFHLGPVQPQNAPPAIVAGSFVAALKDVGDRAARRRCYDATMQSFGFYAYPSFEQVDAPHR
jgi:hypothetical protein